MIKLRASLLHLFKLTSSSVSPSFEYSNSALRAETAYEPLQELLGRLGRTCLSTSQRTSGVEDRVAIWSGGRGGGIGVPHCNLAPAAGHAGHHQANRRLHRPCSQWPSSHAAAILAAGSNRVWPGNSDRHSCTDDPLFRRPAPRQLLEPRECSGDGARCCTRPAGL